MNNLAGIGKADRDRLSILLRKTKGVVSVDDAVNSLGLSRPAAAKLLARWAKNGWLSRVRRGLYVPVPLESRTTEVPLEDPWQIADHLYAPCYIGGWSAAEHWDLTEQIFRTVVVMTTQRPRDRRPTLKDTTFWLRTVQIDAMFGLKSVWRDRIRVDVSDPTRTILDMLDDPAVGGGIRPVTNMFRAYLNSDSRDLTLLIQYADGLGNGSVFKRLGFLLELYAPDESTIIAECLKRLTAGNVRLDTKLPCNRNITRWRLFVPETWKQEYLND